MFSVRPLQNLDLDAICEILLDLQSNMLNVGIDSWNRSAIQKYSAGSSIVLGPDGRLFGFLIAQQNPAATELLLIATAPGRQRQGAALFLMKEWIQRVPRPIWLEVHETNRAAKSLYLSLGFQEVGRRPRYYRDGGTAISMSLL